MFWFRFSKGKFILLKVVQLILFILSHSYGRNWGQINVRCTLLYTTPKQRHCLLCTWSRSVRRQRTFLYIFAFLGNLAVIVAVMKTPCLQTPSNILLCSLCASDCLTGLIAQPVFCAWRLVIHGIHESCDHQADLFEAVTVSSLACPGWSFVNISLISVDRHYALAKPLIYRASVTKKGICRMKRGKWSSQLFAV